MSGRFNRRPQDGDDRAVAEMVDRLRRDNENLRASDIPIEPIDGLLNVDGSAAVNIQEALEAIARSLP